MQKTMPLVQEVLVFPKNRAPNDVPASLHCPCDRCTHTLISPHILDWLRLAREEGMKVEVVSGYSCQLNWLGRHGVPSGNKCLLGLAIRVKVLSIPPEEIGDLSLLVKVVPISQGKAATEFEVIAVDNLG